ncbi:MAG: DUF192 domain-containing protein [Thiobacillaceae bacterium]|nr:DUF192 domain-containing protein [Thiobacillaceae bacterium]MCX7673872.1 DUF192 domain-containing protein [Thiobacillaceae bacterium]MDW8322920.1 DUF192 domain-containing protein [Burkholderiales bacterium]
MGLALAWMGLPGWATSTSTLELHVQGARLQAELAITPGERERGLMHRQTLPPDHGMLFVFASPTPVCMWMKNTVLPLSVAFIGTDGRILALADMQPLSLTPHCAPVPVPYALEVPLGWFARHGVGVGSRIDGLPGLQRRR